MLRKRSIICLIMSMLLIATMAACAKKAETPMATSPEMASDMATMENKAAGGAPAQSSRKLIFNANATIRVKDIQEAVVAAEKNALDIGGYVRNSFVNEYHGRVTLMIPAGDFDAFLGKLDAYGKVLHKEKGTQDVTELYFDTEIRIKNLEAELETLRGLLRREGWKVSELLEIEREIRRLTDELELLKGQLTGLDRRVEFSQLDIEFAAEQTRVELDDRDSFIYQIKVAFNYGIEALMRLITIAVSIVVFLVPLLPVAIVIYILVRFVIKPIARRTKKNQQ